MASLLLRLFHSDYFSPHLALSYLRTYSDNIGITYYLVTQLETAFPSEQVELYWPQLCHLLITKPSESRALESFVLRRCTESVHVALLTLWYFQAALSDLSSNPNTASFHICHRVFNQCQRILFEDPLISIKPSYVSSHDKLASPSTAASSSTSSSLTDRLFSASGLSREKVSPFNPIANIVGMGSVLASVPGMPKLATASGTIAIEQARKKPDSVGSAFTARASDDDVDDLGMSARDDDDDGADSSDNESLPSRSPTAAQAPAADRSTLSSFAGSLAKKTSVSMGWSDSAPLPPPKDPPSAPASASTFTPEITSGGSLPANDKQKKMENPFSNFAAGFSAGFTDFRDKAAAAVGEAFGQGLDSQSLISIHPADLSNVKTGTSKKGKDTRAPPPWSPQKHRQLTFGQQAALSRSVPNLVSSRGTHGGVASVFASSATLLDSAAKTEAVLTMYDSEARSRLLRSNYCKVQTQFILSLQDISARLLLIPKPARLSALRAELTALNHKLPSDVCFPLWCKADDKGHTNLQEQGKGGATGRHHKVVRINPSEAVVLNSADRVPYLLHVEVLNNDLDFDPERRQNRETLRRLVTEEDTRRRKIAAVNNTSLHDAADGFQASPTLDSTATPPLDREMSLNGTTMSGAGTPKSQPMTPALTRRGSSERAAPPTRQAELSLPLEDEEEVDLTEQAYGSDLAAFGHEKESGSSDDEDLSYRNKLHDAAAWTSSQQLKQRKSTQLSSSTPSAHQDIQSDVSVGPSSTKEFSLDEYAQRMRTAAIMLSQLNKSTNATKAQAIVNYGPESGSNAQGGWSSWIVPTNWYGSSTETAKLQDAAGGGAGTKAEVGQGTAGVSTHLNTKTPSVLSALIPMGGGAGPGVNSRLVHSETEAIRQRIMQEMMSLEEERMRRMKAGGQSLSSTRQTRSSVKHQANIEDEEAVLRAVNKDDPSAAMFSESWASKKLRIRASSPYGHLANWDVFSVIVKTGADLRQEQLAVQLINEFGKIWQETKSRCWVRYFRILVTSESSGLMETITDAVSIHSVKKEAYSRMEASESSSNYTLYDHFLTIYGPPTSSKFAKARKHFIESLAAYSIISYLLQIKDRHNGNILVDGNGRLIHIDFGFMLGISPGGVGFEAAPFKMPQEYIDILGGLEGPHFDEFKSLMRSGFRDVRKHAERIIMLVELMAKDSKLPCFALGDLTAANLRDRFQLALSQTQCDEFVDKLILNSAGSAFTRLYDMYQRLTEGVL